MLTVLSLGAGVQSTTLALMAAHSEITPMPDCAIFADTGWEPQPVYRHLEWLVPRLPFSVVHLTTSNIRDDLLANARGETKGRRSATAPFYVDRKEAGQLPQQCTSTYKIEPINKELRKMIGVAPRQRAPKVPTVELWLGISTDEAHRMKPAKLPWIKRRWPLIERRMSRGDCLEWLRRHDFPQPPKSSCVGCPHHSTTTWRWIKHESPQDWAEAVAWDAAIRGGLRGTRGPLYLHRSMMPLDEVDLRTHLERGQPDLFGNECEGICGV